ncbi:hypothetical protein E4665_05345 [Sporolactobacillus shoreae]|uniref:Uncharacterized protein n=1 Tax=Sporolactobacillus shoreae TaxID=1465501 RepID=A0A4Z0GSJ6_9BACL|nr:hypothetical protein E4665_05345 [Sporolactobacillus shoreae]
MLSIILFLSYFPLLFLFFITVLFRVDQFSTLLMYGMILWSIIVPFIVLFIEERKPEKGPVPSSSGKKSSK